MEKKVVQVFSTGAAARVVSPVPHMHVKATHKKSPSSSVLESSDELDLEDADRDDPVLDPEFVPDSPDDEGEDKDKQDGGKDKRAPNFSDQEFEVMVEGIMKVESVLVGVMKYRSTAQQKRKMWNEIIEKVNAVSVVPRTKEDLRKRWNDTKRRMRQRIRKAIIAQRKTGEGGPETLTWPAWQEPVLEILNTENMTGFPDGPDTGDATPPKPLASKKKVVHAGESNKQVDSSPFTSTSKEVTNQMHDGETVVLLVSDTTDVEFIVEETSTPHNQEDSFSNILPDNWLDEPAEEVEELPRPIKRKQQSPLVGPDSTPSTAAADITQLLSGQRELIQLAKDKSKNMSDVCKLLRCRNVLFVKQMRLSSRQHEDTLSQLKLISQSIISVNKNVGKVAPAVDTVSKSVSEMCKVKQEKSIVQSPPETGSVSKKAPPFIFTPPDVVKGKRKKKN